MTFARNRGMIQVGWVCGRRERRGSRVGKNRVVAFARVLALAVGVALVAGVIAVRDSAAVDDPPSIAVSVNQTSVDEGNNPDPASTTNFRFTVAVANPADGQTYTVHWHVDGSATKDSDYSSVPNKASGDFTLSTSNVNDTVQIKVKGDTVFEPDENVKLTIDGVTCDPDACPDGLVTTASKTTTIKNDDPKPTISIGSATQLEGNSGTNGMPFPVTLSNPSSTDIHFHVATSSGSALDGEDFTGVSSDFTIPAGATQPNSPGVVVPIKGDTKFEDDEFFTIQILSADGATIANGSALGTIQNDDEAPPPPPEPTISVANISVKEGTGGTTNATFAVKLSEPADDIVTFHWATADGTAKAPDDYTAANGDGIIIPGDTEKDITISVNPDGLDESNEVFSLVLSSISGADAGDTTATATIQDDDVPTLSIADATVTEGGVLNFVVTLTGGPPTDVTVDFATAEGPSQPAGPNDYTPVNGTLTFKPGEATKTIAVQTLQDTQVELTELLVVNLSNAKGAGIGTGTATGRILDNDSTPVTPPTPTVTTRPPTTTTTPPGGTNLGVGPSMVITVPAKITIPRTNIFTVTVGCPAATAATCTGTVSLLTAKETRLAVIGFGNVKAGTVIPVKLKLNAAGVKLMKALKPGKTVNLMLRVLASAGGSAFGESEKFVSFKYAPAKKPKAKPKKKAKAKAKPKTSITVTIPDKKK
jgi:hypothetical protein